MMKIYGVGPSRSFRAVWGALEAGVDFEYVALNFGSSDAGGTHSEDYLKINSQSKFPSLVEGDFILTESGAILNYLANKSANHLMPIDGTHERAIYDQMCLFVLTELEQALWTTSKHRFALPEQYRVPEVLERTTPFEFAKAQKALIGLMADRPFAVGDHFTMADVLLAQTLAWAQNFKFEVDEALLAYKNEMFAREACVKAKALVK